MTTYETYPRRIRALSTFTMMDEHVSGFLVRPGDVVRITPNMFENTRGTDDNSWLTLTPAQQIAKWGQQRFEIVSAQGVEETP